MSVRKKVFYFATLRTFFLRNVSRKWGSFRMLTKREIFAIYLFSSGTASDSICPKGWRLPGYSGSGSYLELLKPYSNRSGNTGDLVQSDTVMQISPLSFLRSGDYGCDSGALNSRTSRGFYWSGHFYSYADSRNLRFYSTYLYPQYGDYRGLGFSLRCLAPLAKRKPSTLPALLLILYVPKVGDYQNMMLTAINYWEI